MRGQERAGYIYAMKNTTAKRGRPNVPKALRRVVLRTTVAPSTLKGLSQLEARRKMPSRGLLIDELVQKALQRNGTA